MSALHVHWDNDKGLIAGVGRSAGIRVSVLEVINLCDQRIKAVRRRG